MRLGAYDPNTKDLWQTVRIEGSLRMYDRYGTPSVATVGEFAMSNAKKLTLLSLVVDTYSMPHGYEGTTPYMRVLVRVLLLSE